MCRGLKKRLKNNAIDPKNLQNRTPYLAFCLEPPAKSQRCFLCLFDLPQNSSIVIKVGQAKEGKDGLFQQGGDTLSFREH